MRQDAPDSGWRLIATRDEAAALVGAIVDLDSGREYTRSELADAADVPLKTLYLVDTLEDLVDVGILDRVDDSADDSEACYALDEDSDVLAAARAFDDAIASQLARAQPEQ
jgi:hypothetical protein